MERQCPEQASHCVSYVHWYCAQIAIGIATLVNSCIVIACVHAIQLKPLNKLWSYFYFDPELHLPSLPEKTSQRKRSREVEGAEEGVKRRKEDEEREKAVVTFAAAAEGVFIKYKLKWCM